jgi:putative DNA primase/helicase
MVIRERREELAAFCLRYFAEEPGGAQVSSNGHRADLSDEEILLLARRAKNAAKFEALWAGDTTGYASHSEADQALISLLSFYTQNEEQLDSLFRRSGLCREKWLERRDYRRRTIERALSNLAETYAPADDGAHLVEGNGHRELTSPSPSLRG